MDNPDRPMDFGDYEITRWHKPQDVEGLYAEWTGGNKQDFFIMPSNTDLIVARIKGANKIIGALWYIYIWDIVWDRYWAMVENVYVAKDYRRKGIGKSLMKYMEREAKIRKCKFIKLTSRKEVGKTLYRSLGYIEGSSFRKEII